MDQEVNPSTSNTQSKTNGTEPLLRNHSAKPWTIHKYGGTAVGKFPQAIVKNVKDELTRNSVCVVVSARSTNVKVQGTTTRFVSMHLHEYGRDSRLTGLSKQLRRPGMSTRPLTRPSSRQYTMTTSKLLTSSSKQNRRQNHNPP